MIEERAVATKPVGFLLVLSIFLLCTMVVASGGLYFYRDVVTKNITKMESDLNLAKNRFEPSKITQLQTLDKRLRASTEILSKHLAISPIFKALQSVTMKTVRFTKFDYTLDDERTTRVLVKMSGVAIGYRSVALQSNLFAQNKYFIDPIFSNLSLDNSGNVLFDLEFSVDPTFVDFKNTLLHTNEEPLNSDLPSDVSI
ncbi:hypothetical protein COU49_01995 [Candidatus Nomurabacteria bacterium CG10_big_fil_rev_8_21_14_0_10_35_16]|uniref:PilN domain-containing protein n=1 Tax=Candidatus Nomurabacteria bacterium CG10_big_fil_rev_8_21_14_0_10_35_16 TaxID=1974731 RepID=A0A2H0TD48_9BACT|nr:MAG: hypothetical protein COU49_01995 [Candidatus Nomurabacteria bacterium CG10_big_fil_rev_8_21_14_0_10_35_16]